MRSQVLAAPDTLPNLLLHLTATIQRAALSTTAPASDAATRQRGGGGGGGGEAWGVWGGVGEGREGVNAVVCLWNLVHPPPPLPYC